MKKDVVYIGNVIKFADEIFLSEEFNLIACIAEKDKILDKERLFFYTREIPCVEVCNKSELYIELERLGNKFIYIMFGFGIILNKEMLHNRLIFNVHSGDLPKYKGRHPIFYALIQNEANIVFTLHTVNHKIDDGEIITKYSVPVPYDKGTSYVMKQIRTMSKKILSVLYLYLKGKVKPIENVGGSYYPPVSLDNKTIGPDKTISHILNVLRAQDIYGGGIIQYGNHKIMVNNILIESIDKIEKDLLIKDSYVFKGKELVGFIVLDKYLHFTKIIEL